jgi:hypothetical protein
LTRTGSIFLKRIVNRIREFPDLLKFALGVAGSKSVFANQVRKSEHVDSENVQGLNGNRHVVSLAQVFCHFVMAFPVFQGTLQSDFSDGASFFALPREMRGKQCVTTPPMIAATPPPTAAAMMATAVVL